MNSIWLIILCGLLAVVYGGVTVSQLMATDAGTPRMQEIAAAIAEGAQAYLRRQYFTISVVGESDVVEPSTASSWLCTRLIATAAPIPTFACPVAEPTALPSALVSASVLFTAETVSA